MTSTGCGEEGVGVNNIDSTFKWCWLNVIVQGGVSPEALGGEDKVRRRHHLGLDSGV